MEILSNKDLNKVPNEVKQQRSTTASNEDQSTIGNFQQSGIDNPELALEMMAELLFKILKTQK